MDRLLNDVDLTGTRGDLAATEVTAVAFDSRAVPPGALFCCLPGTRRDGHDYAPAAVAAGAAALLVERPLPLPVPQAVVAPGQARHAMALAACTLHGHPAEGLSLVGVTGTNGKTTVTRLLADLLAGAGRRAVGLGTLDGARTTPEAPDLQRRLGEARSAGIDTVVMEVSSHALVQARVDGFRFDVAVFTNLSHDHLDYHGTMQSYFAAKATLFTDEHARAAVVNVGDPWGRRLAELTTLPVTAYSPVDATDVQVSAGGTDLTWRGRRLHLPLIGAYHVANAVAAATTAVVLGLSEEQAAAGLGTARPVPGRFEPVPGPAPYSVVVDYAHTPDGLAVALASARILAAGHRVVVVFGCGGDRDRDKRPAMGAAAAAGADLVVVTADNSRSEATGAIIDDILAGVGEASAVVVEPARRAAIARALAAARPGDVVLLAGKGHETTLEVGGQVTAFDDRQVAAELLGGRPSDGGVA